MSKIINSSHARIFLGCLRINPNIPIYMIQSSSKTRAMKNGHIKNYRNIYNKILHSKQQIKHSQLIPARINFIKSEIIQPTGFFLSQNKFTSYLNFIQQSRRLKRLRK